MIKSPCKDCSKKIRLPHCAFTCEILSDVQERAAKMKSFAGMQQRDFSDETSFPILLQDKNKC